MIIEILFTVFMVFWLLSSLPLAPLAPLRPANYFLAWLCVALLGAYLFVPALR